MEKTVANRIAFAQTRDLLLEGQNVRICVQGQSMLPFFRSGSVITLRPLRHEDLRRGAVVMAETVQGNFVVHRIIQATPEEVTLLGDGNLTTETMPPAKVYGVVDCSAIHRVLARVWLWLRPVRRYPLWVLQKITPESDSSKSYALCFFKFCPPRISKIGLEHNTACLCVLIMQ